MVQGILRCICTTIDNVRKKFVIRRPKRADPNKDNDDDDERIFIHDALFGSLSSCRSIHPVAYLVELHNFRMDKTRGRQRQQQQQQQQQQQRSSHENENVNSSSVEDDDEYDWYRKYVHLKTSAKQEYDRTRRICDQAKVTGFDLLSSNPSLSRSKKITIAETVTRTLIQVKVSATISAIFAQLNFVHLLNSLIIESRFDTSKSFVEARELFKDYRRYFLHIMMDVIVRLLDGNANVVTAMDLEEERDITTTNLQTDQLIKETLNHLIVKQSNDIMDSHKRLVNVSKKIKQTMIEQKEHIMKNTTTNDWKYLNTLTLDVDQFITNTYCCCERCGSMFHRHMNKLFGMRISSDGGGGGGGQNDNNDSDDANGVNDNIVDHDDDNDDGTSQFFCFPCAKKKLYPNGPSTSSNGLDDHIRKFPYGLWYLPCQVDIIDAEDDDDDDDKQDNDNKEDETTNGNDVEDGTANHNDKEADDDQQQKDESSIIIPVTTKESNKTPTSTSKGWKKRNKGKKNKKQKNQKKKKRKKMKSSNASSITSQTPTSTIDDDDDDEDDFDDDDEDDKNVEDINQFSVDHDYDDNENNINESINAAVPSSLDKSLEEEHRNRVDPNHEDHDDSDDGGNSNSIINDIISSSPTQDMTTKQDTTMAASSQSSPVSVITLNFDEVDDESETTLDGEESDTTCQWDLVQRAQGITGSRNSCSDAGLHVILEDVEEEEDHQGDDLKLDNDEGAETAETVKAAHTKAKIAAVFGHHPYHSTVPRSISSSSSTSTSSTTTESITPLRRRSEVTTDDFIQVLEQSGSLLALNDFMNQIDFEDCEESYTDCQIEEEKKE